MLTITTHQAKTHLSRYLAEVRKGTEFTIARGKTPVAMLVPLKTAKKKPRPKVGETLDPDHLWRDGRRAEQSESDADWYRL